MIYECCVVIADGGWGIEQYRQQVLLDVPYLGRVFPHAFQYELNMFAVQLQKTGAHYLMREVCTGDPSGLPFGADNFQHQIQDFIDGICVAWVLLLQILILDVFANQIPIVLILTFRFASFHFRRITERRN